MTESKHTPGRLKTAMGADGTIQIIDIPGTWPETWVIAICHSPRRKADADHLVACWNACEGLNPSDIQAENKHLNGLLDEIAIASDPNAAGILLPVNLQIETILARRTAIAKAKNGK